MDLTPVFKMMINETTMDNFEAQVNESINDVSSQEIVQVPVRKFIGQKLIISFTSILFILMINALVWGLIVYSSPSFEFNDATVVPTDFCRNSIGIGLIILGIIFILQIIFYSAVLIFPLMTLDGRFQNYLYIGFILPVAYFFPAYLIFSYSIHNTLACYGVAFLVILIPACLFILHVYCMASSNLSSLKPFVYGNPEDVENNKFTDILLTNRFYIFTLDTKVQ